VRALRGSYLLSSSLFAGGVVVYEIDDLDSCFCEEERERECGERGRYWYKRKEEIGDRLRWRYAYRV